MPVRRVIQYPEVNPAHRAVSVTTVLRGGLEGDACIVDGLRGLIDPAMRCMGWERALHGGSLEGPPRLVLRVRVGGMTQPSGSCLF